MLLSKTLLTAGSHGMLIDSHAHLEMPEFKNDLEEVIRRAQSSGVEVILTVGTEEEDWERTLEIARSHPKVYAVLGVHPHHAKDVDAETYPILKRLCMDGKVKGYGEIGLDFFRNLSPRDLQIHRFREQIALSKELKLPIVVHDRDAHRETLEILKSEGAGAHGGIIHCFSGDDRMARACIDMGFLISIPGTITFKNAGGFQEMVKDLPLDSLLIETDAPFLAPVPFRGKRNEPAFVLYTARRIAEVKKIPLENVAEATTANALRVFGIRA